MFEKTIKDSVEAELKKMTPEPNPEDKPQDPPAEPNDEQPKTSEDAPADAPKGDEPNDDKKPDDWTQPKKKADEDDKEVEIDDKFKVVSYKRFKEINDKYKKLKEDHQKIVSERKVPEDEDEKETYDNFKKLWFADKSDIEIEKIKIQEQQLKEEESRELDKQFRTLEKSFDGSDWLPEFKREDVMKRGLDHQVYDPKSAYIIMNLNKIVDHFVKKELKARWSQPSFAKSEATKPDLSAPKDKQLSDKDWSLQQFLKEKVQAIISG